MRSGGCAALVVLAVVLLTTAAFADCGCTPQTAVNYMTFESHEVIGFSLVVPGEYFWIHNTMITPLITAWRVETQDGLLVRAVEFEEPRGIGGRFSGT